MKYENHELSHDLNLIKAVLSQICEKLKLDSTHLWYLEMDLTTDQIAAIDRILVSYTINNEVPSLEEVTKDIKDSIEIDFHEDVVKRLLISYKTEELLPIAAKILDNTEKNI